MVQRWIQAASPAAYLTNFSRWDHSKNHSDARRGRKRNKVSVSTKGGHLPCDLTAKPRPRCLHSASPSLRQSNWKTHPPTPQTLVWSFSLVLLVWGNCPWEEKQIEKEGPPSQGCWPHSASAQVGRSDERPFARDLNIPKMSKASPSDCRRLEEQQEKQDLVKMSFHPGIMLHVFPSSMLEVEVS